MNKVLIVDDEQRIRDLIKEYLDFEGFSYDEGKDGLEAIELVKTNKYDIVIASEKYDLSCFESKCVVAYFANSNDISVINNKKAIGKYQRVESIYKQILDLYSEVHTSLVYNDNDFVIFENFDKIKNAQSEEVCTDPVVMENLKNDMLVLAVSTVIKLSVELPNTQNKTNAKFRNKTKQLNMLKNVLAKDNINML